MFLLRVFIEPFLNFKFRFFKYFVSNSGALSKQILLAVFRSRSELRSSGWSRSRYFLSGAEIFYRAEKVVWSWSRGRMVRLRNTAFENFFYYYINFIIKLYCIGCLFEFEFINVSKQTQNLIFIRQINVMRERKLCLTVEWSGNKFKNLEQKCKYSRRRNTGDQ